MSEIILRLPVKQVANYPIKIQENLFPHPDQWLPDNCNNKKLVIITDDNINKIYGAKLFEIFNKYDYLIISFSPGEMKKNYQTKQFIENKMLQNNCDRESIILAIGGGVVGDLAGFVAATYMRGISYIQIPTTLLAMIDSSIGGKTGINTEQGKNLIGAFWQPLSVVIDTNFLSTLSLEHIINGLIEAIKIFLTSDQDSFYYLNNHVDDILQNNFFSLKNIIERAVQLKVDIVTQDERESGPRMILNFGHTIGHALEKVLNYNILHGYAVGLGILVEVKISELLGLLKSEDYQIIRELFLKLNISGEQLKEININEIILATQSDKKNLKNTVRYVLLKNIGEVYTKNKLIVHPVSDDIVKQAIFIVSGG